MAEAPTAPTADLSGGRAGSEEARKRRAGQTILTSNRGVLDAPQGKTLLGQ